MSLAADASLPVVQAEDLRRLVFHASDVDHEPQQREFLPSEAAHRACVALTEHDFARRVVQLIYDGSLQENGLIRLDEFVCNVVQERK